MNARKAFQVYRLHDKDTEILGQFFNKKDAERLLLMYQQRGEGKYGIRVYKLSTAGQDPLLVRGFDCGKVVPTN